MISPNLCTVYNFLSAVSKFMSLYEILGEVACSARSFSYRSKFQLFSFIVC
jgi:hypothetical protein